MIGDNVMIAWNCSTETARDGGVRDADAAPGEARHGADRAARHRAGASAEELARSLQRHGLATEWREVPLGDRSVGEAILREAASAGVDLLVKGAYTQSRLRQMIFGGATSHILAEAELPVLMAN